MMKILGLSAHTDDIEWAAGGKLVKDLESGHEIKIAVFSYCQASLPAIYPFDKLRTEFQNSMQLAGITDYEIYDIPVRNFLQYRQLILDNLIEIKSEFNPDLVITHSRNDVHQDHQVVAIESIRAFKNSASILAMQMPHNNLEFRNQYYEKLTESHVQKKIELLKQYESQYYLGRQMFKESITWALARVNGFCCNAEFAEVFEVIRMIQ